MKFKTEKEKEAFVHGVFTKVAKHYDLMNTLLSFHMDTYWRRYAVKQLQLQAGMRVLDVACGTCMMTMEALAQEAKVHVTALDFNQAMLALGRERLERERLMHRVTLCQGDAMDLPYGAHSFDVAMSAFAMRNVPSVTKMLSEMKRVVRPGGRVVTLELAKPSAIGFRQLYYLYFEKLLPLLGSVGGTGSSYGWLPESLRQYPHQEEILKMYKDLGFKEAYYHELTGGIVAVHCGIV